MRKLSVFIAAAACAISQPAFADIGRIKNVTTGVQIIRDGQTISARSGLRLEQGDIVRTGR